MCVILGDINARGVIQLKGSVVQEKAEKSNEKIIVIINPNRLILRRKKK